MESNDEPLVPIGELLDGLRAKVERSRALPCAEPMARGDLSGAVTECFRLDAAKTCGASGMDGICPRRIERRELAALLDRLASARIPGAEALVQARREVGWSDPAAVDPSPAEVIAASRLARRRLDGSIAPKRPLQHTDSIRVVVAWTARQPVEVPIAGGATIRVTGSEWALVLGGDLGVGKTVAACVAALDVELGLVVRAPELAPRRGATDAGRAEAGDLFERALAAPLLVLDELGAESDEAQWSAVDAVVEVLARRYDRRRRTIITTNLTWARRGDVDGIAERYDPRVRSRLDSALRVGIRGPSLRRSTP